ncbi:class I SAM-dependent methyltransferase [Acuticoccus sp. MNP-M23]|uniref:class I SAM-dependent methyltransferase n=1 Tax=Acuticoccus sp. MNP-M23 TaxID=3072793 RepID=UPI002815533D|nr:class I SAM-dependent methyltransferase [Acuticoccus sp. MNP-M23]WMS45092.1 class I SAM-dependent methyltransferase [Acuticoccus sp. MNP-M23]
MRSPFVSRFRTLPNYYRSYHWPHRPLGVEGPDSVRNENLPALTFGDDTFDLVITSDVLEQLFDIEAAFAEILRVLKPGGRHIFTIPNAYPLPDKTEKRVAMEDGREILLQPARYHNSGDGTRCLVYTDYGADLVDMIRDLGGETSILRRSAAIDPCYMNATFVTRKPATGTRPPSVSRTSEPAAPKPPAEVLECPICKGNKFEAFNGRANARCSTCRSVERNRMMFMVLENLGAFEPDKRILHFAPEAGIGRRFLKASGEKYHARDLDVSRYKSRILDVREFDLCRDLGGVADESYDVILHSHVLEHLPCDVNYVLQELHRILAPGGLHIFSVPIRGKDTIEDLSPNLSEADRLERFGQEDHFRIFGADSLTAMLAEVWGEGDHLIEPLKLFGEDALRRAVIPTAAWAGISSHSLFYCRKALAPAAAAREESVSA